MTHELWLDGRLFTSPSQMHAFLARILHFPAEYGNNWDALYDMLTSLSAPVCIYFTAFNNLQQQWGRQASVFRRVLQDAAAADSFLQIHFFSVH